MAIFCIPGRFITNRVEHLHHSTTIAKLSKRRTDAVENDVGWSTLIRPCRHKSEEISAGHQLGIRLSKRQLLEGTFTRTVRQVGRERADSALHARSAQQLTWAGPSRESPRQLEEPRKWVVHLRPLVVGSISRSSVRCVKPMPLCRYIAVTNPTLRGSPRQVVSGRVSKFGIDFSCCVLPSASPVWQHHCNVG